MAYEFKNLSGVDFIETPAEDATVLGINEGQIVQMPRGGGAGGGLLVELTYDDLNQ